MSLRKNTFLYGGLLASLAILAGLAAENREGLQAALAGLRWPYVALALAAVLVGYALIGLSLWEILRLLGYPLGLAPAPAQAPEPRADEPLGGAALAR